MRHWLLASPGVERVLRVCQAVLDRAREAGYVAMQFNAVVATNDRAVRLWRSMGFEEVGRVPGAFRHAELGPVDLLLMHRRL